MDYSSISCECGSYMAPIMYGMPTAEMIELARLDIIALGGISVEPPLASHYCYECSTLKYF